MKVDIGGEGVANDVKRVLYGVQRSITDIWTEGIPETISDMSRHVWTKLTTSDGSQARKDAYADMELDSLIRQSVKQTLPEASTFVGRTATGFGDNFGFLLTGGIEAKATSYAAKGMVAAERAAKAARAGVELESGTSIAYRGFEKLGAAAGRAQRAVDMIGKDAEAISAARTRYDSARKALGKARLEITAAGKDAEKLSAARGNYTKAKAELDAARGELETADKGFGELGRARLDYEQKRKALEAAGRELERSGKGSGLSADAALSNYQNCYDEMSKAGAKYGRLLREVSPEGRAVAKEKAAQFAKDILAARQRAQAAEKWVNLSAGGVRFGGKAVSNAGWYLPFYTRNVDRSVANGEPLETAMTTAFVTMVACGWAEKWAMLNSTKMNITEQEALRQSWSTIVRNMVGGDLKTVGTLIKERLTKNVIDHGMPTAINVTAESVLDEMILVAAREYDKSSGIHGAISKEAFLDMFSGDAVKDMVEAGINVINESGYSALGFAALSGSSARFGHWRAGLSEQAFRKSIGMRRGEAWDNYAYNAERGLLAAHQDITVAQNAAAEYFMGRNTAAMERNALDDNGVDNRSEEQKKSDSRKVIKDTGDQVREAMTKVMELAQKDGVTAERIAEETGVDMPTAELMLSMAQDYRMLAPVLQSARMMYEDYAEANKIVSFDLAKDVFLQRASGKTETREDGTVVTDLVIGRGEDGKDITVRAGMVPPTNQITRDKIARASMKGSSAGVEYDAWVDRRIEDAAKRGVELDEKDRRHWNQLKDEEREHIVANGLEGVSFSAQKEMVEGSFFVELADGTKLDLPFSDVVALTKRGQNARVVRHETSHTIYRVARKLGYITDEMEIDLADAFGIDRTSDYANEIIGGSPRWQVELDERIANGYAEYTRGMSAPAHRGLREAFPLIDRALGWVADQMGIEDGRHKPTATVADLYDVMYRGDLSKIKDVIPTMGRNSKQAIERAAATEKLDAAQANFDRLADMAKRGRIGKNSPKLKAARRELAQAQSELDKLGESGTERFSLATPEEDAEYEKAFKAGDTETVQRLLRTAAERAGYSADTSYRISHHAPMNDGYNASLDNVKDMFGTDDERELMSMGYGRQTAREAVRSIVSAKGNPDAMIDVWRAVPKSVKDVNLRRGDWVALSEDYARQHGESWMDGKYKLIHDKVRAGDLFTDGNMLEEAGFDDGKDRVYADTKNGTKLMGPTFDDDGNLIQLSKRFNTRKADTRYSLDVDLAKAKGEYDDVVAKYTNPDGTKKKGWMKAPNGKATNLTESQWVQVRTQSFKKWFGDWERAYYTKGWKDVIDPSVITGLEPVDIRDVAPLADKNAIIAAFDSFGTVANEKDGRSVRFPKKAAGRMVFVRNYAGAFKRLFETSTRAWSEDETKFEGHKEHDNIEQYHHYLNKFKTDEGEFYVRFTVRQGHESAAEGRDMIHAAKVTDVRVYSKGDAQTDTLDRNASPVDYKIANFLDRVNEAPVSKVVDENGEPLVVYHGTPEKFAKFDMDRSSGTIFTARTEDIAYGYGEHVMQLFANVRNPYEMDAKGVAFDMIDIGDGEVHSTNSLALKAGKDGFDGAIIRNVEGEGDLVIALDNRQVKSATDNVGTFDANNDDIRFSLAEPRGVQKSASTAYPDASEDVRAMGAIEDIVTDDNGKPLKLYRAYKAGGKKAGDSRLIFATDEEHAKQYGERLESFYAVAHDPLYIDARGNTYAEIPIPEELDGVVEDGYGDGIANIDDLAMAAYESDYDALIVSNVYDSPEGHGSTKQTDYVFFDKEQLINKVDETRYSFADDAKALIMKKRPDLMNSNDSVARKAHYAFSDANKDADLDNEEVFEDYARRLNESVADAYVAEIMKFSDSKTRKAALNWFIKGAIKLPEDAPKVEQAMKYTVRAKGKANTDPLSYASPMEMMDALHEFKPKAKPINPDKVPELSDKREMGNGVVTYLVQDDREGQKAMRQIINTHWGEDANPWCLLHGDGKGNLSDGANGEYDAWYYWNHYNALPKRVAFKDGKLLAFMATDDAPDMDYMEDGVLDYLEKNRPDYVAEWRDYEETDGSDNIAGWLQDKDVVLFNAMIDEIGRPPEQWWDRQDSSHTGIPLGNIPVPNDQFGRWANFEIVNGKLERTSGFHKGDVNGFNYTKWGEGGIRIEESSGDIVNFTYKEWDGDGSLSLYKVQKDGQTETFYSFDNGELISAAQNGKKVSGDVEEAYRIFRENDQRLAPQGEGVDAVESDGTVRMSLATYDLDGRDTLSRWLELNVMTGDLTREDADDIIQSTDTVRKIMGDWAKSKKYASFGKWSTAKVELDENGKPFFGVIRTNGDYAYNIDFSTVCKKRRPLDAIFNELVRRGIVNADNIGKLLSRTNIPKLQDIIKRHGLEVACALCFVDAKRYNLGKDTEAFAKLWNNLVDEKQNNPDKFAKRLADAKNGKTYVDRCVRKIAEDPAANVRVDPSELISGEAFDKFVKEKPEVATMYRSYRGQAKAKESTLDVPYNNDILRLFKHSLNPDVPANISVEQAFAVGGVRLQSFSDFVSRLTFDYVQMFADLAARKLPLHSYTKEPDFIKLFGKTGAKLNMSLVPNGNGVLWLDESDGASRNLIAIQGKDGKPVVKDGKVAYFDFADECFPPEQAFALRSKDGNVGTIMVGVSDEHIELMMNDPRIDMVIPYHKSSINPEVAKARGIDKFTDYTAIQHTKGAKKGKDFDWYGDLAKTNDPRQSAKNYLSWCKANKYTGKFEKFSSNENYYKLLADFRLFDADGNYSPQKAVRQVNPDAEWQKAAMEALAHDQENSVALERETEPVIEEIVNEVFGGPKEMFSLAIPTEVSNAFSAEDLLSMAAAGRLAKARTKQERDNIARDIKYDMGKRLRQLRPEATEADVSNLLARSIEDSNAIGRDMQNSADAQIINRLTDRQIENYMRTLRRAGQKGIKAGATAERALQDFDKRAAQKVADSIAAQTGIAVNELEVSLGVDLAETMLKLKDIFDEAEKARGADAAEADSDEAEEADPMPIPMDDEQLKEAERQVRELCEAIRNKAWQDTEEWKAKREERAAKRAESHESEDDTGDMPTEADIDLDSLTPEDLAQFVAKRGVDLMNPEHFARFIAVMCEQKWIADHGLNPDAYVWSDPVALQHLRMTALGVYDSLARKLMYSGKREQAFNQMRKIENAGSYASVISAMEFAGRIIAQGMVTEKAKDLVNDIEKVLEQAFGAKGRFTQNKENGDRKVAGYTELWARDVKKVIWWGEEKCANEMEKLMERLSGVEAEFLLNARDPNSSKRFNADMRLLGVLRQFGGLVHRSLGEITDARVKILDRLDADKTAEEAEAREKRTQEMADILDRAFDTGAEKVHDDVRDNPLTKAGKALGTYLQMHLDFKHLLLDMMRSKDANARRAAETFVENLQHDIQRRWDAAQTEMRREREWFHQTVESIYGKGTFGKVMSEMLRHDPRFDKFGRGEINEKTGAETYVKMSKAQALNLYVAMQQNGYRDNVVKNGRQDQSAELRALFDKKDLMLVKALGDWYDRGRQGLSDVSVRLFGVPVEAEEANYFPVTPLRPSQGLEKGSTSGWSPFPPSLTARIRHGYDFDVRADIFSVWADHMQQQAQWKNMADLGVELRGIFGRQNVQSTIRRCHGQAALQNTLSFITDILNGQMKSFEWKWITSSVDWLRGWSALASLGGNLGVMLKQTTSIPAFAFEIGFVNLGKHLMTAFTPEGIAAMGKIWTSDQRVNRWDVGNSEEVTNALSSKDPSLLKRLMQKSMIVNKIGDAVPALLVGQGIFRSFVAQGLDETEAMNRTWEIINRTQQTGQMDNLSVFQRRSSVGRALTQFQSTVRQYTSYELAAIRQLLAKPMDGQSWLDFSRATVLNAMLGGLYALGGSMWQWILGRKPDDDDVTAWVESMMTGSFSSLFLVGSFAATASSIVMQGKKPTAREKVPALDLMDNMMTEIFMSGYQIAALLGDAIGWCETDVTLDDLLESNDRFLKRFNSMYRDAVKAYRWRVKGEDPRARKPRRKR
ncbi:MAG: hypothetical protein MJZ81_07640 [Bacteroidales bacterium]|nr:hypothetical protein [Bacteroidales bacterium]